MVNSPIADNLIFTHVYGTPDFTHQAYMPHSHGLWYTGAEWSVFNEIQLDMDTSLAFNVLIIRDNPVGIANITKDAGKIKVTPNPAKVKVTVLLNSSYLKSLKEIRLSSMDGQTILHKNYNGDAGEKIVFDLAAFSQGLYILTAVTGKGILSTKVNVVK